MKKIISIFIIILIEIAIFNDFVYAQNNIENTNYQNEVYDNSKNEVSNSTQNESEEGKVENTNKTITESLETSSDNEKENINLKNVEDDKETEITEEGRTIKDGIYKIETKLNPTKVISVENESKESGANVRLWGNVNLDFERFEVKYLKNGYYSIICVNSNMSLDVYHAGKTSGTNIAQSVYKGGETQQWYIKEAGDGYYYIISKWNNLCVDVYHASEDNGTNIQMSTFSGGIAQKFLFSEIEENEQTISDGVYTIASKINTNKALDVDGASLNHGQNVWLWDRENVLQQQVKIKYLNNGFYSIRFMHSNLSLDADKAGWYHGTNIAQSTYNGSTAQQWIIKDSGKGYYNIICRCNGLYMDVYHASMDNGTNIALCDYNGNMAQQFIFIPITEVLSKSIEDGAYQINTKLNSNYVLEVSDSNKADNANIQIWNNVGQGHQIFKVKYLNNGYYTITSLYTDKVLELQDSNKDSGTNIVQNTYNGGVSQQWIIRKSEEGYYNIISRASKLYMDIHWAQVYNGNNVQVSNKNDSNAQKFSFKEVETIKKTVGTYGISGLKVKGDSNGSELKYYKIGNGPNVFFGTFAVHGFEDLWNNDGQELTKIAKEFIDRLMLIQDKSLADKWTIYIIPSVNPDGEYYGWTNNGPGRTSLYSEAPDNKGIDINRCWSVGYKSETKDRNYNGTQAFQAYEAQALRDFLLNHRATNGQTVLVDLHGWLNETIGDEWIGGFYRSQYGISKHIPTYGNGYLVNWARSNLGYGGRTARTCLVEMPEYATDANKYIYATINMLREL